MKLAKLTSAALAILIAALFSSAHAMRQIDDEGGEAPGGPGTDPPLDPKCARLASGIISSAPTPKDRPSGPAEIALGQSATLSWSVTLPPECTVGSITLNGQPVASQGSVTVQPMSSQSYGITFEAVQLATAQVNVTLPNVVKIKGSTAEWRDLLIQAVGTQDIRVVLAHDVDIDLTNYCLRLVPAKHSERGTYELLPVMSKY